MMHFHYARHQKCGIPRGSMFPFAAPPDALLGNTGVSIRLVDGCPQVVSLGQVQKSHTCTSDMVYPAISRCRYYLTTCTIAQR